MDKRLAQALVDAFQQAVLAHAEAQRAYSAGELDSDRLDAVTADLVDTRRAVLESLIEQA